MLSLTFSNKCNVGMGLTNFKKIGNILDRNNFNRKKSTFYQPFINKEKDAKFRSISRTLSQQTVPLSKYEIIDVNPFSKRDNYELKSNFPEFMAVVTSVKPWGNFPEFKEKLSNILKYNVKVGANARAVATLFAYKKLKNGKTISAANIKEAIMTGWCIRMLESAHVVLDDIVDNSTIRFNRPCWFKNQNVGLNAIIDGLYMETGVFYALKKFLYSHPQYLQIVELFQEYSFRVSVGQSFDVMPHHIQQFNMDYYTVLAVGKAEYLFYPLLVAMYLANISDENLHQQVRSIVAQMGKFHQIQNDFMDCYGDPEEIGKDSTDIREGKCTWFAVTAFQKSNPSQRRLMEEHYGKDSKQSIKTVINLYNELNLLSDYRECEKEMYKDIRLNISKLPESLPHDLFYTFQDKLFEGKWGV